jgi:RNA polymerase sigma-70 factor (ECF subfamily)
MDETHARLNALVRRARKGDLPAFGEIVALTQAMACAVALGVLRDPALAQDAAQEAYLRAFRRLGDLTDPAGFLAWFRRVVITVALNMRRARRTTLLRLDDVDDVPVLDEAETSWTEAQRLRLAAAVLTLTPAERRVCDRRYHGRWSVARLAQDAGVPEPVMRKRLQRVRDKLRKEIDVSEQRALTPDAIRVDLPSTIVELLARPQLTVLPEHPVGEVFAAIRGVFASHAPIELPEIVDLSQIRPDIAADAMYVEASELHRLDDRRILRYDLTLPLLAHVRYAGQPLRLLANGKAYRRGRVDATHLEAFHQAEVLYLDERAALDPWRVTGQVLESIEAVLPGRSVRISPSRYAMCTRAWELEVDDDGHAVEVMAWGVFTDAIVRQLGGDPTLHTAIGIGYGLERLAMLRYGIDDIRKVESARVA